MVGFTHLLEDLAWRRRAYSVEPFRYPRHVPGDLFQGIPFRLPPLPKQEYINVETCIIQEFRGSYREEGIISILCLQDNTQQLNRSTSQISQ